MSMQQFLSLILVCIRIHGPFPRLHTVHHASAALSFALFPTLASGHFGSIYQWCHVSRYQTAAVSTHPREWNITAGSAWEALIWISL